MKDTALIIAPIVFGPGAAHAGPTHFSSGNVGPNPIKYHLADSKLETEKEKLEAFCRDNAEDWRCKPGGEVADPEDDDPEPEEEAQNFFQIRGRDHINYSVTSACLRWISFS